MVEMGTGLCQGGKLEVMMKRIVIIAGNARSLIANRSALIAHWRSLGHEVEALVPTVDWLPEVEELGIPVHRVTLRRTGTNPADDLAYARQVFGLLRERRPSHVMAYGIKPVVYGLLAARAARVPQRYALITGMGYLFTGESLRQRVLRIVGMGLYRTALAGADRVFFQNPDDMAFFAEEGLVQRRRMVRVWGSGIDLERFPRTPLPEGPPVFLLIARLLMDKGVVEYFDAVARVRAELPGVRFQLLGPHDPMLPHAVPSDVLQSRLEQGHVEWLGETKDVRPFIEGAHVVVLPSYREGTPRAVLEAMAMGRAALVSDVPGCRETVVHGENGLLFRVRDASALAEAISTLAQDRAMIERMGAAGRARAEGFFDVRKVNETMTREMGLAGDAGGGR